ncbi:MAG: thioredoxin fold domain-containing protein [Epsilonproteobacteria bacterium]|nr:thioredoxin fold domain-containing protein [Campylobacterota bacterium]
MIKKLLILVLLSLSFTTLQASEPILQHTSKLVANGKNVLLLFETKTCAYCELFKKDIKENKILHKLLKDNFNVYSIPLDKYKNYVMGDKNPPKKTNTTSLKMGFTVKATPNILIFDKNWNKIIQLPGYADPKEMKIFLNYVIKGIYKKEDLSKYLKESGLIN